MRKKVCENTASNFCEVPKIVDIDLKHKTRCNVCYAQNDTIKHVCKILTNRTFNEVLKEAIGSCPPPSQQELSSSFHINCQCVELRILIEVSQNFHSYFIFWK